MTEQLACPPLRKPIWARAFTSVWMKIGIAVLVIYALVALNRIDPKVLANLSGGWLVLALILMLPPYLIVSYRFWVVLKTLGVPVSFRNSACWTMIGSFFDTLMPSASGGDAVKTLYVVRKVEPGRRVKGIMSVTLDRIIGLLGLFWLAGLSGLSQLSKIQALQGGRQLLVFLLTICFGSLLFFRFIGSRRLRDNLYFQRLMERLPFGIHLRSILVSFNSFREHPGVLFIVLGLSVLNHIFWCTALFCITKALSQSLLLAPAFTIFPLAIFGNVFGFAGGFGLGTLGFDVFFAQFLGLSNGALIGLIFQTTSAISRLSGLPFYVYSSSKN